MCVDKVFPYQSRASTTSSLSVPGSLRETRLSQDHRSMSNIDLDTR
jgi:hypothetical protein